MPFAPFARVRASTPLAALFFLSSTVSALADDIESMIVTAHPREAAQSALAAPVNVLDSDTLAKEGGTSLGAALSRQIGVSETGFAAGSSRPIIRGQDQARVRVTENGVGVADVSDISVDHGVPVDPLAADRIEILRGPATLRYGSQAIGGIVNVITSRVPKALTERPIKAVLQAAHDTASDLKEGTARLDASASTFALHADAFRRDTNDYKIPIAPGRLEFSDAKAWGAALGGGVVTERGRLGAAFHRYGSRYAIPGPEDPSEPLSIDLIQSKWLVEGEAKEPLRYLETVRVEAGVTDYLHNELHAGEVGSTFINKEWELRSEIAHQAFGPVSGAFGFQASRRNLSAGGEGAALLAPSLTQTRAGYLFEEIALTKLLTLSLAGRIERVSVEGTPASDIPTRRRFTPLSGALGLIAELDNAVALGGTFTLAERAPAVQELFSRGPHDVSETFEIGDPALGKETAFSGEIFVQKREGRVTGEVRGYYTRYDGFIFPNLTGVTVDEDGNPDPLGELRELFYVQEDVTFRGVETEARATLGEALGGRFGISGRFDYVRATRAPGGNVPRIPPLRYGGGLFLEGGRVEVNLDVLRVATQKKLALNETPTRGYTDLRASMSLLIFEEKEGMPELKLLLSGDNLLNAEERNHASFKKDDVLAPARSFRLTITARI
jgi:iron complex outermembrane receptor protein